MQFLRCGAWHYKGEQFALGFRSGEVVLCSRKSTAPDCTMHTVAAAAHHPVQAVYWSRAYVPRASARVLLSISD